MSTLTGKRNSFFLQKREILAILCAAAILLRCILAPALFFPNEKDSRGHLISTLRRQYAIAKLGVCRDIANVRFDRAMQAIERNKDAIEKAGKTFGLPPEVIAAVILKEQFTRSAPDFLVVALAPLRQGRGSTGLGAVTAKTAKKAYGYFHCLDRLPRDDQGILRRFMQDEREAIFATACVLAYESAQIEQAKSGAGERAQKKWRRVYNRYNGDLEYANKTIEYLPPLFQLF